MKSIRAKAILAMVDADTDTANNCEVENAKTIAFSPWGQWMNQKKVDPVLEAGLNKLYAQPYSMTSAVSDQFCETQNTRNSHHFHELESHLVILNETFQPSSSLKSQVLTDTARPAANCLEGTMDLNLLYLLLVHLVNSDLITTTNISLHSFEPGHTFMSADQVHHQVELSMKKIGKIYDFTDFKDAVSSINNGKVSVESLTPHDFLNIPNFVSDRRIQKSNPRAYLKNMVQVTFQRSNFGLMYKNDFDDEFTSLQFMNDKYLKSPSVLTITFRTSPKGIDQQRKSGIVDKLETIIPIHKLQFWKNLPTTDL